MHTNTEDIQSPPATIDGPRYVRLEDWRAETSMTRSFTYQEIRKGNLRAKKCGRALLIDRMHGLAWIDSLPDAVA